VERLMTASNQIFLVMDAGSPVAAFTVRHELKAFCSVGARRSLTRWSTRFGATTAPQS
jgi:hypothetical protein